MVGARLGVDGRYVEPLAHGGFGDEVPRSFLFWFELAADVGEVDAQVVRLLAVLRAPDILEDLPLGTAAMTRHEAHEFHSQAVNPEPHGRPRWT